MRATDRGPVAGKAAGVVLRLGLRPGLRGRQLHHGRERDQPAMLGSSPPRMTGGRLQLSDSTSTRASTSGPSVKAQSTDRTTSMSPITSMNSPTRGMIVTPATRASTRPSVCSMTTLVTRPRYFHCLVEIAAQAFTANPLRPRNICAALRGANPKAVDFLTGPNEVRQRFGEVTLTGTNS